MSTTEVVFQGVPKELQAALTRKGFAELTSIQKAVLDTDSQGKNFRISSQTGSGKTIALGIVIARHFIAEARAKAPARSGPGALVITPTRELAVQVAEELDWLYRDLPGVGVTVVTGGMDIIKERRALAKKPAVLVGTPGRLLDHMRSGAFRAEGIAQVVLDEADQMLDMGFREELEDIVGRLPKNRCSHLVSATFPDHVRHFASAFQKDAVHLEGTRLGVANVDIQHVVHLVKPRDRYAALVNVLLLSQGERTLIFVRRRIDAAELAEKLAADGFPAQPFSGELPQAQRTRTLNAFRMGTLEILVATDVAARGIDVPDIAVVIQIDLPMDADSYTHRCGRTGRAGKKGRSLMLAPPVARRKVERVFQYANVEAQFQPAPEPKKVMRTLVKRMRKGLRLRLTDEKGPLEPDLAYADQLLEGHDPRVVVATLMDLLKPQMPCAPKAVKRVELHSSERRGLEEERGLERDGRKRREPKFAAKASGRPRAAGGGAGARSGRARPGRPAKKATKRPYKAKAR